MLANLRNIAIIAHVDHGKTTLVDCLLKQSGTLNARQAVPDRVMDSNDIERERGITILAKNTAIRWGDYRVNIVDTPGHADFGGEVERVLSMVDSVLLLVDAVDGPMPQTRFVTRKAFERGLKPIVVINKIDRPGARPDWVINQTFDLFDRLGATEEQLDFPVVYTSALMGYAGLSEDVREGDMTPLFQTIIDRVPPPPVDQDGAFQMQISQLDYSSYVGVIGIGRIQRGRIKTNTAVTVIDREGKTRQGRVLQVLGFHGLARHEVPEASAGDIIAITGVEKLGISDTICAPDKVEALPALTVDEPTISMFFCVNNSPFAGREGKFLTSRQIRERLLREAQTNVALRVEETEDPDKYKVSGRGELHLSILIENMRREGYELAVSRPEVIIREVDGVRQEPYEHLVLDLDETSQGGVMERLGERRAQLKNMENDGKGRTRLEYIVPSRGLIGFQTEFRTLTGGTGLMFHVFDHYGPAVQGQIAPRSNGVMISNGQGVAPAYSLFNLQERGRMLIQANDEVYEGMLVGIHAKDNDLTVNPLKSKQLTNFRAAGKDDALNLIPAVKFSLEQALEFIEDDELVEITPKAVRLRKKLLKEQERTAASRGRKSA
jgi:GTP-binding protein